MVVEVLKWLAYSNEKLGRGAAATSARAAASSASLRSQLQCAGPGCPRKAREDGAPLEQCGGWLRTYYCGRACQAAHWKRGGHKAECKALAAEGRAAEASGPPK